MAPIKSQNSNMLLAFLTLLGVIASRCAVTSSNSYRDRLKLPSIAFRAKFRDVYWNFA